MRLHISLACTALLLWFSTSTFAQSNADRESCVPLQTVFHHAVLNGNTLTLCTTNDGCVKTKLASTRWVVADQLPAAAELHFLRFDRSGVSLCDDGEKNCRTVGLPGVDFADSTKPIVIAANHDRTKLSIQIANDSPRVFDVASKTQLYQVQPPKDLNSSGVPTVQFVGSTLLVRYPTAASGMRGVLYNGQTGKMLAAVGKPKTFVDPIAPIAIGGNLWAFATRNLTSLLIYDVVTGKHKRSISLGGDDKFPIAALLLALTPGNQIIVVGDHTNHGSISLVDPSTWNKRQLLSPECNRE
jgi:DNA-binding beta-propeller fold protein YncE